MSFTGNPGTGKTTVALRMADILHRLGYIRSSHLVSVTRDDLVGQYIGHTAPKTKEILKKAMGGVLFIDEAYYLYRPENERDYGQEAIEILLQVMESQRDDLVVILAGYSDRMDRFFTPTPASARASPTTSTFPDYTADELLTIAELMLAEQSYRFSDEARRRRSATTSRTHDAAAFRQRALDPQRARPRTAAPGRPAVRARAAGRSRPTTSLTIEAEEIRPAASSRPRRRPMEGCGMSEVRHRALDPVRRLRAARRGGARRRRGRRRLDPSRRDGRPFRPQHHLRPGRGQGDPRPHATAASTPT